MAEEEKSLNAGGSEIKKTDDDSESNKAGPSKAEQEKAPNAECSEIKEADDDSESNKAGPSKDEEEKALDAGCSEIKEIDDDSVSNKAGPSKAVEGKAPNAGCSEIKDVEDDPESNKASPSKAEALLDSEPEPAPAQSRKITSVVPRPDDWKAQREMEENMTDEERLRMQAVWRKNQATQEQQEEGANSEQDKPQTTKGKGRLDGMELTLEQQSSGFPVAPAAPRNQVLRPPIVPVIKPSDYEAIQNRNEELSDEERARAMQQTRPFPGPHPVDPTCACWECVRFLQGRRD